MVKLAKNWTRQTQRTYQTIFDSSHICSTRRNLKNYQKDVFMEKASKELNAKAYIMTIKEEEALNQWLDEQLKASLIVESKSRYATSCFYIPKKDSSLQLVQDYRKLNQITIKDKMLLPLIREVIDKLKKAKYFNKLDLIWEYNNI